MSPDNLAVFEAGAEAIADTVHPKTMRALEQFTVDSQPEFNADCTQLIVTTLQSQGTDDIVELEEIVTCMAKGLTQKMLAELPNTLPPPAYNLN